MSPAFAAAVLPTAIVLPVLLLNTMPVASLFSEATTPVLDDCSLIACTALDKASEPVVPVPSTENEIVFGSALFSDSRVMEYAPVAANFSSTSVRAVAVTPVYWVCRLIDSAVLLACSLAATSIAALPSAPLMVIAPEPTPLDA